MYQKDAMATEHEPIMSTQCSTIFYSKYLPDCKTLTYRQKEDIINTTTSEGGTEGKVTLPSPHCSEEYEHITMDTKPSSPDHPGWIAILVSVFWKEVLVSSSGALSSCCAVCFSGFARMETTNGSPKCSEIFMPFPVHGEWLLCMVPLTLAVRTSREAVVYAYASILKIANSPGKMGEWVRD